MARQAIQKPPVIILTRPKAQSERFAGDLSEMSAEILVSPVIEIVEQRPAEDPFDDDILILTSSNAVILADRMFGLAGRSGFVVGSASASTASALGLTVLGHSDNSAGLLTMIKSAALAGEFLYLRGRHTSGNMTAELNSAGFTAREIVIYDQMECPLSNAVLAALRDNRDVILPLFSARTAEIVSNRLAEHLPKARLHLVSISSAVDLTWRQPDATSRCVASLPESGAMMDSIRQVMKRLT